jgi:hypothetical protein
MEKTKRQPNVDITGYSPLINEDILNKVANRVHPMAKMPYYHKKNEPTKLHEEEIVENRYKGLIDSYVNTFGGDIAGVNPMGVMMNAGMNGMMIMGLEKPKRVELVHLVERIMREEWNISEDEILFDLEIVDVGGCSLPDEMDKETEVPEDFEQSANYDVLKKRTINALSQGSALASHYIFHMYRDDFERLCPNVTDIYQKALIANDLFYFILDDNSLNSQLASDDDSSNAGYCRLNFDGEIPVIEAKAISAPILLHEVTKALITFFSIPGIQNMDQETINETDYVMAELWDIRFGTTLWGLFHSIIDENDYDIKKLIIMEVFKIDSETFIKEFMYNVMNNQELAKKELSYIVKKIRSRIMEYEFEKDSDGIDLSDLGIY